MNAICHICMTSEGRYGYKQHGQCQYSEKLCRSCAKKMVEGDFDCPVCRNASCKDVISYNPEAELG